MSARHPWRSEEEDGSWSLLADCEVCGYPISATGAQAFSDARAKAREESRLQGRKGFLSHVQLGLVHQYANRAEAQAQVRHRSECERYARLLARMDERAARRRQKGGARGLEA